MKVLIFDPVNRVLLQNINLLEVHLSQNGSDFAEVETV